MDTKKPPDEMRTLKIALNKIVKNESMIPILFDAVTRTNQIIIHTYQFLRLWILDKYHSNKQIPKIDVDIVHMASKALLQNSSGPKPGGENKIYYEEFLKFYDNTYKDLGCPQKLKGTNLSGIFEYSDKIIVTSIENNIKLHFFDYIRRFVNTSFSKQHSEILDALKGKEKVEMANILKKELLSIKNDLMNNTKLSKEKYHEWINIHRPNIFPNNAVITQYDVNQEPYRFIKNMIYMNIQLENNEQKLFQFFPLRTSIIPKYITIDTKALIDLFEGEGKGKKFKELMNNQKSIWEKYFNLNHNIFKMNDYSFNYMISTDCHAVSINFMHNDYVEGSDNKKKLMKEGREKTNENTKGLTKEEKSKVVAENNALKNAELKAKKDKEKEEYNKLSKEEKKKFNEEKKKLKEGNKPYIEFPYLEELSIKTLKNLQTNCIYIDPGKRDLLTIIDDNDNLFRYSNKQYIKETKRKEYGYYLQYYRDITGISEIEHELSNFNSKSCSLTKFKEYVNKKNEINKKLFSLYYHTKFRQYRWYSFINKQRANDNLLNTIKKKYSKNGNKINIVMGDWGKGKQMRNFIPTPMIGMKRTLAKEFNVYTIDEFRTSKLHYKTEKEGNNLYVSDKNGDYKKLHSVLTFQMENKSLGCINRDVNAVKNMRKLVKYYFYYHKRPTLYSRTYVNDSSKVSSLELTVNMPSSTFTSNSSTLKKLTSVEISKIQTKNSPSKKSVLKKSNLQEPKKKNSKKYPDTNPDNNSDSNLLIQKSNFQVTIQLPKLKINHKVEKTQANNSDDKSLTKAKNVDLQGRSMNINVYNYYSI